jgi:hypothetical protein
MIPLALIVSDWPAEPTGSHPITPVGTAPFPDGSGLSLAHLSINLARFTILPTREMAEIENREAPVKVHTQHRHTARGQTSWARALVLVVLVGGFAAVAAAAPDPPPDSSSGYAIRWFSVDGGGGTTTGGVWTGASALGQPDAGSLTGSTWELDGGFVVETAEAEPPLFADDFEDGTLGAWSSVVP